MWLWLQAVSFTRLSDEVETWMDEVETQLSSEDHGKDIISVNALLKKHQVHFIYSLFSYNQLTRMEITHFYYFLLFFNKFFIGIIY